MPLRRATEGGGRRLVRNELDKLRFHLDSGGYEPLDLDDEAARLAAALAHEAALVTVKGAADDADVFAIEEWRHFVWCEIADVPMAVDGADKLLHFLVAHLHGVVLAASTGKTILQGGQDVDDGIEDFAAFMDEDKVGHERHGLDDALATAKNNALTHRHKHLVLQPIRTFFKVEIGGTLGVGASEVAQDIPIRDLVGNHRGAFVKRGNGRWSKEDGADKRRQLQSCEFVLRINKQAVTAHSLSSSGLKNHARGFSFSSSTWGGCSPSFTKRGR